MSEETLERATLTVREAAAYLGIARNSAYRAVAERSIPAIRVGRRLLVPRKALDDLLSMGWQPPSKS